MKVNYISCEGLEHILEGFKINPYLKTLFKKDNNGRLIVNVTNKDVNYTYDNARVGDCFYIREWCNKKQDFAWNLVIVTCKRSEVLFYKILTIDNGFEKYFNKEQEYYLIKDSMGFDDIFPYYININCNEEVIIDCDCPKTKIINSK